MIFITLSVVNVAAKVFSDKVVSTYISVAEPVKTKSSQNTLASLNGYGYSAGTGH